MTPLAADEMDEEHWRAMKGARDLTGYPHDAPLHPFLATLVRHPEMFSRFMAFGMNFLLASELAPRDRELVILRTGWLCDAPYEWGEHVAAGLDAGLTQDEVGRIGEGPQAAGWSERDRAILCAVDELHTGAMISDEVWNELAAHFDERQLLELPVVVGHYHMTAFLQNALRFVPGRDPRGLPFAEEESMA